jgi:two-component system nitrogen regulation sensor histidine kinase GlnL
VNAADLDALGARRADPLSFGALDLLATMVAIVDPHGHCVFVNAAFEEFSGCHAAASCADRCSTGSSSRRSSRDDRRGQPQRLLDQPARGHLRRQGAKPTETFPVHVIVNRMEGSDDVVVELVEVEQQTRQAREERALEQAQATKELIRNLAHEIKNPLGGIRGAAQLLEMEVESRALTEYTQVIINEADRLQGLVDRLLAPHRKPHVVGDVNIHEVCERVRALILAEFPRGLKTERDYDISIPDFRGDREQLIQAVLNIAKNAAQALESRIEAGDARIMLRTRINRQITLGKHRYRLALELHIEDNGPGVPETLRDRIFFPLVSGREGGIGIGSDAGTNLRSATPGHRGMRERARQDHLQDTDSAALSGTGGAGRRIPGWQDRD